MVLKFEVIFISLSGKQISKIFRNVNDVSNFVAKYQVDEVIVTGEDWSESYSSEEFEENFCKQSN